MPEISEKIKSSDSLIGTQSTCLYKDITKLIKNNKANIVAYMKTLSMKNISGNYFHSPCWKDVDKSFTSIKLNPLTNAAVNIRKMRGALYK